MKYNPGDKIVIRINSQEVETIISKTGVQRLPQDSMIDKLWSAGLLDLNHISIAAQGGEYPRRIDLQGTFNEEDRFILYRDYLGYSVSGFQDVFPDAVIENPLWEKE